MHLDKVYVIPNYECSLDCKHCELHKLRANFSSSIFLTNLSKIDSKEFVIFGGEPTLYINRLRDILSVLEKKNISISTNLFLTSEKIEIFKTLINKENIFIATSWNPKRFNENQLDIWFRNLEELKSIHKEPILLITLTKDLFNLNYSCLEALFDRIDKNQLITGVLFEHYIGPEANDLYNQEADNFLCHIYKEWRWNFNNFIIDRLRNWNCNCSKIATLEPGGSLRIGCPQFIGSFAINNQCLSCSLASICNPCYLQTSCSFPKKLYELVKKDKLDGSSNK